MVVQLDGAKRWRLYGPTRSAPMYRDVAVPEAPLGEPVADLVLTAGDILYLPRGWWHAVAASEDQHSLHVTCGLQSATGADLISWLSDNLRTHESVRAEVPRLADAAQQQEYTAAIRKLLLEELDRPDVVARFAQARDAVEQPRLSPSLPHIVGPPADPGLPVRLLASRPALAEAAGGHVLLTAGGEEWTFAAKAGPLLARLLDGRGHTLAELAQASGITVTQAAGVVAELVNGQVAAAGGTR